MYTCNLRLGNYRQGNQASLGYIAVLNQPWMAEALGL